MDLGLERKCAWVLGASSGLGRASALALAAEGASVAISARRRAPLDDAAEHIASHTGSTCIAVPLDVTEAGAIEPAAEEVLRRLGGIDVLVCNAGGPTPGSFDELDDKQMREAFALTTASAWRLVKTVLPSMRARGGGAIVFITSSSTKEVIPGLLLSNMMRASVVGLAKTLSKELAEERIRVVCVAPGRIHTARLDELDARTAEQRGTSPDRVRADQEARIPLGRYGTPAELGDVVAFLASDRASYVTGITVTVDGGALNGLLT